jgi:hypothetical protein
MANDDDGLTPTQRAWLNSHNQREAFSDLSKQEVNNLTYSEWARRTGQPTLGQIASQGTAYAHAGARSSAPTGDPSPANSGPPAAPPGPAQGMPDFGSMTPAEYAQWRESHSEMFGDGQSRASVSMRDRMVRQRFDNTTRQRFYR